MRSAVSFLALFATWVTLSGHYSPYFLLSGAACCGCTVWLMGRLQVFGSGAWPLDPLRLVALYLPWLVWQVLKANVDVARRVWSPRVGIEPQLVRVPCRLRTEDLGDPASGKAAYTEGQIEGQGAGGHRLDAQTALLAHLHDRALAELLLDLPEGHVECFLSLHCCS